MSRAPRPLDAHVVAAALFDATGRVLLAQRPPGKHMAGGWEFPGGKCEPGEERLEALKRELREEIGVELIEAEPLIAYDHEFADRTIRLDLWFVLEYRGTPQSLENQNLKWVRLEDIENVGLLEADTPMIEPLRKRARRALCRQKTEG